MESRTPITVRYGETDMMGVVYHANYLLYFEDARIDFLEKAGCPYQVIEDAGYMSPVRNIDITYHSPLRYGEKAFVTTRIVKHSPVKVTYEQRVFRDGMDPETDTPLVAARLTFCTVDRTDFKPINLKRALPDLYARYEVIAEG